MQEYALKLIQEAYEKKSRSLDLGNCGLEAIPREIEILSETLEELSLSSWYDDDGQMIRSKNALQDNNFKLDDSFAILKNLQNLKVLITASCNINNKHLAHIAEISNLIRLDISRNYLRNDVIPLLSNLLKLSVLNLDSNACGDENLKEIGRLQNLTVLKAFGNDITEVGAFFISSLKKLTNLDLSFNKITNTGVAHLCNIPTLKILSLWHNEITDEAAESFANLHSITDLNLNSNSVGDKSARYISKLSNLTSLSLRNTQVGDEGAEALSSLSNLKMLSIVNINISSKGVESINKLSELSELYIDYNHVLDSGAESISKLPNLKILSIAGNNIGQPGAAHLSKLSTLSELNIEDNQLGDGGTESISELLNLNKLYIGRNFIGERGTFYISKLRNLQWLYIENNDLGNQGCTHISNLTNLTHLSIDNNAIGWKGCTDICKLSRLTLLKLASNYIEDDGAEKLSSLQNLTTLDLRSNQIRNLPFDLVNNVKLEIDLTELESYKEDKIFLAGNPIESPPKEVFQQGRAAILEYLQEAQRPLNECKLIFVGEGSVGKTSIMKKLVYDTFDPHEKTTHGINKIAWDDLKNNNDETIRVNLWDFGGQHIQHSLHQFFFTERVIYVLVLDPRNDQTANYWLDQIEKLGRESQCIVVYNWKQPEDKKANYLGNFYELRKTYPRLQDPILLSCATGEGMDEFRSVVKEAILSNDGIKTKYPVKWFDIKAKLEKEIPIEANYIEYSHYEKICAEKQYNDAERRKNLLKILNSIGSIVFFDKPILNQLQILNPEWITTGAYAILTSKKTNDTKGHLKWDDLKEIFAEEKEIFSDGNIKIKYSESQFQFILQLMLDYRLCQKNPLKDHEYLVPSAFGEPPRNYEDEKLNCRQYRLQFNSAFEMLVIHRFIAKNIVHIVSNDYWNSGIYFKHSTSDTHALVDTSLYSNQINCWIKGENIRGLWEVIRNDFREIFKMYNNFPFKEEVLYESNGRSVFLPYEEMLNSVKNGMRVIPYHPTYELKDIDVMRVLELFESPEQTSELMINKALDKIHIEVAPRIEVSAINTVAVQAPPPNEPVKPVIDKADVQKAEKKVRQWKNKATRTLIVGLIITVLLVLTYTNEWLFSTEVWDNIKKTDIVKWAGIIMAFVWNTMIGKIFYDRHFDPSKEKAFRDTMRLN